MTATDPERLPDESPRQVTRGMPDPWGVRRAENLITSLQGVLSARVVVSPVGEVIEVHVLTNAGTAPKQVVRNVESALLAQLGLKIDHRKISVAQTAEVKPIEVLEKDVVREAALRRVVVFRRVEVQPSRRHRVMITVSLSVSGDDVVGEAEAADTLRARVQAAGRATVIALDKILPEGTVELEGVQLVSAFDEQYAFAGVTMMEDRGVQRLLVGTCEVREGVGVEQAAVLAVLDGTNRWVQSRR